MATSSTPRDMAVFIDGTWNRPRPGASTNVRKLYEATRAGPAGGREQVKLYLSGVGTRPVAQGAGLVDQEYRAHLDLHLRRDLLPPGLGLARPVVGGAFGTGTTARIKAAYQAICGEFERHRGDRVYLFGFSRGAFAARSLAGFINTVGLLLRSRWQDVPRAYELYESGADPSHSELADHLFKLTGQRLPGPDSDAWLPLHFLGVWDTVAALGLPSRLGWLSAPFTEYHQVDVPPNVMHARHGLALHELRSAFEPLLWRRGGHASLEQVWFPGAHADVGGGYGAGETGLSDAALRWMAHEAQRHGLALAPACPWLHPAAHPPRIHHEIRGLFLATLPTARSWLRSTDANVLDTHHFHPTARDHLFASPRVAYEHLHPFVNAALRQADALAAPRLVASRLRPSDGETTTRADVTAAADPPPWWTSVTPDELAQSQARVDGLLAAGADLNAQAPQPLARALAIVHLCLDDTLVPELLAEATRQTDRRRVADEVDEMQQGLERCAVLTTVFEQALAMLGAPAARTGQDAWRDYTESVTRLRHAFTSHIMSKGLGRPLIAPPRYQLRKRP